MIIYAHIFFAFTIIMIGSDFAAIYGGMARELSLPASGITPFTPLISLGIYFITVLLTRRNRRFAIRAFGVLGGYLIASLVLTFPNFLFDRYSTQIKTRDFLLPEAQEKFEQQFQTPTVHYSDSSAGGPWLAVPRDKFDEAMIEWVSEHEGNSVEPTAGENASRPTA